MREINNPGYEYYRCDKCNEVGFKVDEKPKDK